jgi:hypothetical protein
MKAPNKIFFFIKQILCRIDIEYIPIKHQLNMPEINNFIWQLLTCSSRFGKFVHYIFKQAYSSSLTAFWGMDF